MVPCQSLSLDVSPFKQTYLIDIHSLGMAVFITATDGGLSLKRVLESTIIPKVFFDIRNDSDALLSLFQVSLGGIKDLQLMELASRSGSRRLVSGLAKCIDKDSQISSARKKQWQTCKELGHRLFAPEKGGHYEVFNERPLRLELFKYYQQDVELLPILHTVYNNKLKGPGQALWRVTARDETKNRIKLSQSDDYNGNSKSMALGWDDYTVEQWRDSWNDDITMEARNGDYVLDKDDNWVEAPKINLEDRMYEGNEEDFEMTQDEDTYQDTARDCIGWEKDMIKNGEYL
jgi:exonuclease 3'-5' domain-containing protein 1